MDVFFFIGYSLLDIHIFQIVGGDDVISRITDEISMFWGKFLYFLKRFSYEVALTLILIRKPKLMGITLHKICENTGFH